MNNLERFKRSQLSAVKHNLSVQHSPSKLLQLKPTKSARQSPIIKKEVRSRSVLDTPAENEVQITRVSELPHLKKNPKLSELDGKSGPKVFMSYKYLARRLSLVDQSKKQQQFMLNGNLGPDSSESEIESASSFHTECSSQCSNLKEDESPSPDIAVVNRVRKLGILQKEVDSPNNSETSSQSNKTAEKDNQIVDDIYALNYLD